MTSISTRRDVVSERPVSRELVATLKDVTDHPIDLLASYDRETFTPLYVGEAYAGDDPSERLHAYFELDFFAHEFVTDALFPDASRVETRVLTLDDRQIITVYHDAGAVLAVVRDDDWEVVGEVVDAVERHQARE